MEYRLEIADASKRFGSHAALTKVSFAVAPGTIVGLIGPNGAGKTTLLRCIASVMRLDSGTITIDGMHRGRRLGEVVGLAIDPAGCHPGMTAIHHLRWQATAAGLPRTRAYDVLDVVGLNAAKNTRFNKMSLGMRQRVNLASALLSNPKLLILDEPLNGLDPPGIQWMRTVMTNHAANGGSVLLSSHLLTELEEVADRFVLMGNGVIQTDCSGAELDQRRQNTSIVSCIDAHRAASVLANAGLVATAQSDIALTVKSDDLRKIGTLLFAAEIALHELRVEKQSLEEIFFQTDESENSQHA
jgi:ABC-2 type transport system ATP-binding protein